MSLDQARAFVAGGLSVIPVPRPGGRHNGKIPALAWREYQTRLPTDEELVAWFSAPMNIAIVTGAISGIVAVDLDSREAARWWVRHRPYTPWQVQTSKGWHLYYRYPGTRIGNKVRLATNGGRLQIDLRADGGFVIGPGSVHETGAEYIQAGDWTEPREALPVFWQGWLAPREVVQMHSLPECDRRVATTSLLTERARRYLAAIPRPEIGQGSDVAVLTAACRLVRGFGLSATDTEALLWDWCGGRAGWTREWVAEKVANAQRYGTEPVGALA